MYKKSSDHVQTGHENDENPFSKRLFSDILIHKSQPTFFTNMTTETLTFYQDFFLGHSFLRSFGYLFGLLCGHEFWTLVGQMSVPMNVQIRVQMRVQTTVQRGVQMSV